MGDRHNQFYPMVGPDHYRPPYTLYDSSFQQQFRRGIPPQPPHPPLFDGMAYYYNQEPQDNVFEHNKMLYNQNLPGVHSPVDQSIGAIKHRRTRSGCFTCRHRRVKCDETRPICERCKKGNRECQFPPTSSTRRGDPSEVRNTPVRASSEDSPIRPSHSLPTVEDEEEDLEEEFTSPIIATSLLGANKTKTHASTPIDTKYKNPHKSGAVDDRRRGSPSSTGTTSPLSRTDTPMSAASTPPTSHRLPARSARWNHLDSNVQQYLQYHHDKISRHHYFLKLDPTDFVHNELIDIALTFEPLLHAIIGFAAYHQTLSKTDGRFQDFWRHYCQSIMLLRQWLETNTDRNEAVLLTILQIATFEEYLGDWAGVSSHLKAAYSIFSTLYTYDSFMDNVTSRCIFDWLARGDVAVSLMSGATTILERQWFTIAHDWHEEQAEDGGLESKASLPCIIAKLRLLGYDIATVHANSSSMPNALKYIQNISDRMESLRVEIQALPKTTQSSRTLSQVGNATSSLDSGVPIYDGELWPLNIIWIDWYATDQMHKYRTMLYSRTPKGKLQTQQSATSKPLPPLPSASRTQNDQLSELEKFSLIQCQLFEAIEKHPHAPAGAAIGCQASLALACVFLPKTRANNEWARRKLAKIERLGYVWAPSFRKRMSQLWNDEGVIDWWLPNRENKIDLLDEIRGVAEERNYEINARGGDERDDVREMKAVFDKLEFEKQRNRTRKDSVWSAAGTATDTRVKKITPDHSDGEEDGEEDIESCDGEDGEEDEGQDQPGTVKQYSRPDSCDSGVGTASTSNTRRAPITTLEYSNRMSGIWEG